MLISSGGGGLGCYGWGSGVEEGHVFRKPSALVVGVCKHAWGIRVCMCIFNGPVSVRLLFFSPGIVHAWTNIMIVKSNVSLWVFNCYIHWYTPVAVVIFQSHWFDRVSTNYYRCWS